jgi:hypothetical protein
MTLRERAESVANTVFRALHTSPSADQAKRATDLIERAIIDVVLEERQRCASVASAHGTPDADLAHKIAEEIRRVDDALIAARAADMR